MKNKLIFHDIKQNTEEWEKLKLGKFSASSCNDLLSGKTSKGYKNLINRIFEEQYTKSTSESKLFRGNWATDRGHELEPIARESFEKETFDVVKEIGFVEIDDYIGCSPDGLVYEDGLIQIKCPIFLTQVEYLEKQEVPPNYYKQMQFELFVTARDYNIFYSYHPKLKSVIIKVNRDDELIAKIIDRLDEAISEVKLKLSKLEGGQ